MTIPIRPSDRPVPDRRSWPIRVYRLGAEPSDDLSAWTTPEERLAMMWPLAVDAWTLAGRELPRYTRGETPIAGRPLVARRTP